MEPAQQQQPPPLPSVPAPAASDAPAGEQQEAAATGQGAFIAAPPGDGGTGVPGTSGVSASAGAAAAEGPIYVSKREVRKTVGKVLGKKTAYYLEFYLIDNHGYETLAAIGEDQGE